MADFVAPNFQYPDMLRSAALGQQMGLQRALGPGEMQGQQQQLQTGQLNLDMLKQMMGMKQQAFQSYQQALGAGQGGPPPSADPQGGVQNGPQTPPSNPNDPLGGFISRVGAANAVYGSTMALAKGEDPNKPLAEGLKLQDDQRTSAIAKAKLQAEIPSPDNPMPMFKAFAQDPNAADALAKNPKLLAMWPQLAQQYGVDPWDKKAVPMVAALEYNRRGAALGLSVDVPHQLQTTQRGLGESIQTDPMTGKISGGAPALPTEKYIVNGQVQERTKAQGVGQGLTPYDSSLYAASIISKPALEDAYQQTKATGTAPPTAGRDPIAIAQEKNYIADRLKQDGANSGEYLAAKQQAFQAQQKVVSDFTDPSGKAGGALVAINTAVKHVGSLIPLIDAMGSGNVTRINQARQAYQTATGVPAPTNYATLANMAVGEINKAVTANGGDAAERESIAAPFDPKGGPDVLKGAVQTAVTALAGKTDALRNAWDVGTNGTQGSFDKLLLPATKKALNQEGDKVSKTIGGKTYVQQNGKWYQQ